jgi:hypothetical protein
MKDGDFALYMHDLINQAREKNSDVPEEFFDSLGYKLEDLLRLKREQAIEDFYHPRDRR